MYDIATRYLIDEGTIRNIAPSVPLIVEFDYVVLGTRKYWRVTPEDHDRLERHLHLYAKMVENEIYAPACKEVDPMFCNYPSRCCQRNTHEAGGGIQEVVLGLAA